MITIQELEYWCHWFEEQLENGNVKTILISYPNQYPGIVIEYNLN